MIITAEPTREGKEQIRLKAPGAKIFRGPVSGTDCYYARVSQTVLCECGERHDLSAPCECEKAEEKAKERELEHHAQAISGAYDSRRDMSIEEEHDNERRARGIC